MSSNKHCCVPGCRESGGMHQVLHRFPNSEKDRNRFKAWLYTIGGDILALDNRRIYKYRRVCHSHFEEKYLCRYNRISNIAVPTLNLPGQTLSAILLTYQPATVIEHKTKNREPTVRLGNRKPRSKLTNSTRTSKKTKSDIDVFDISRKHNHETDARHNTVRLSAFFVNRLANGSERRTANTDADGEYYIHCKMYRSEDVRLINLSDLWKKALIRLKLQTDVDSTQWRKLQEFITSADTLFPDSPTFYDN